MKWLLALCLCISVAHAETKLIVPAGPGGLLSRIALSIQEPLSKALNDTVVIEHKPGAQGLVGYTYLQTMHERAFFISAPQEWMTSDLHLVHSFGVITGIVVTKADSRIRTMADAVEVNASYGVPSTSANVGLFRAISKKYASSQMIEVPFKSGPDVITNVLGGHVDIGVTTVDGALPYILDGKLRALGVFAYTRSALLKDIKTLREQGLIVTDEERYFNNIFLYSNRDTKVSLGKLDGMDIQSPKH